MRPNSLDMRAKACNEASLRLCSDGSAWACCREVERPSSRWEREFPIRPMRAAVSPTCAAFRMAAKVRASDVEWDRALVSLQQAWSSFKYSSEEGTENVAGAGLRLKKALAWADSVYAASSCR